MIKNPFRKNTKLERFNDLIDRADKWLVEEGKNYEGGVCISLDYLGELFSRKMKPRAISEFAHRDPYWLSHPDKEYQLARRRRYLRWFQELCIKDKLYEEFL